MASIVICTAAIQYGTGKIDCHCRIPVDTPLGPTELYRVVDIDETATLPSDWTDAQLCEAVAEKLNVPVTDVAVASGVDSAL